MIGIMLARPVSSFIAAQSSWRVVFGALRRRDGGARRRASRARCQCASRETTHDLRRADGLDGPSGEGRRRSCAGAPSIRPAFSLPSACSGRRRPCCWPGRYHLTQNGIALVRACRAFPARSPRRSPAGSPIAAGAGRRPAARSPSLSWLCSGRLCFRKARSSDLLLMLARHRGRLRRAGQSHSRLSGHFRARPGSPRAAQRRLSVHRLSWAARSARRSARGLTRGADGRWPVASA